MDLVREVWLLDRKIAASFGAINRLAALAIGRKTACRLMTTSIIFGE
jgi:hypothetical protein